jgi:hypothetical protein
MTTGLLALVSLLWPPLLIVFVLKVFPDFVGKLFLKGIEHQSEIRLTRLKDDLARETSLQVERAKAELQASYSTLKTSVDVLATGQSGMRVQVIAAVSTLWAAILELRTKFGDVVTFGAVFTSDEITAAINGSGSAKFLGWIERYRENRWLDDKSQQFMRSEIEAARLFCGDRLWLLFYVTRAVYIRLAWLTANSLADGRYQCWREDHGIASLLAGARPADVIALARETQGQGLMSAMSRLEADFLHEATRVMSGSKAISDSLSDMQAVMLLATKRATEVRPNVQ